MKENAMIMSRSEAQRKKRLANVKSHISNQLHPAVERRLSARDQVRSARSEKEMDTSRITRSESRLPVLPHSTSFGHISPAQCQLPVERLTLTQKFDKLKQKMAKRQINEKGNKIEEKNVIRKESKSTLEIRSGVSLSDLREEHRLAMELLHELEFSMDESREGGMEPGSGFYRDVMDREIMNNQKELMESPGQSYSEDLFEAE